MPVVFYHSVIHGLGFFSEISVHVLRGTSAGDSRMTSPGYIFPIENGQGTIEKSTARQNKTIIAQLPKIDLCF